MNNKPDEQEWMDYLYGEMNETAKRKFDQYLLANADARQELERFQNLRSTLSEIEDKEVIAPPIVISDQGNNARNGMHTRFWNAPYVRTIASLAASLLLVILVGKLSDLRLHASGNELSVRFGAIPKESEKETPAAAITEQEVQQMINASLERNNVQVQASLEETQRNLDASIRKNLALSSGNIDKLVREASTASQQQIRQYVEAIRAENMQQVKDYFQLTSTEQKQYIENLLVDFAKYLQQQRNDDLQLVQTRMNSLEQNTDVFRQETEQILSSIITTVGNPMTEERKN